MRVTDRVEFAARRRSAQEEAIEALRPVVAQGLRDRSEGIENWYAPIVERLQELFVAVVRADGADPVLAASKWSKFETTINAALAKTDSATGITEWLAVATINAATIAAAEQDPEPFLLQWVTMADDSVRAAHRVAEGQLQPPGEKFQVGESELDYPGDPKGARIQDWISCRCVVAPVQYAEGLTAGVHSDTLAVWHGEEGDERGATMTTQTQEPTAAEPETIEQVGPIPWHGVLAPEGVWSGDRRRFAEGSLEFRDLPLPLTWQKVSADGHKQSVVVGDISAVEKVGNLWEASGTFLQTPEADEVVGLISHFGRFGVSIDADNGEFEIDEDDGAVTFTKARGCSACIVPIPAFQEAYVAIGERVSEALVAAGISDKPWDGSAGRFTPEQWKASCILHVCDGAEKSCHKLPIREPGGALSRAGVHAAASRFGQVDAPAEAKAKAKSSLRGAYKQLGEEPPEAIAAAQALEVYDPVTGQVVTFKRGPGWVTHPADTKRIHDYWTKPGEPGYAKIAWGTPDDFYRCRALVGEKIATNSPEDMRYINQICARWHKDALGFWPGEHSAAVTVEAAITAAGEQGLEVLTEHGQVTEPGSVSLVAAATSTVPASWFADPELKEPTHLTVTEDGRVFGHIALWQTCHIGFQDMCVTPPESGSSYAYFLTKEVLTDQGPVSTGVISLGGGHAGSKLRAAAAVAHYDSTSTGVADVAVGEDEHGIWCAGRVRPGVSPDIVSVIRASDVSGDWRKIGDHKELVAVLAVNVAGFPVPRTRVGVDNGEQVSLVAAGMVPKIEGGTYPSVEEIATAVGSYLAALNKRQERLAELRAKVLGGRD